ncbi:hypothetical protein LXL04_020832 [Taraxacum kok-saghyz]
MTPEMCLPRSEQPYFANYWIGTDRFPRPHRKASNLGGRRTTPPLLSQLLGLDVGSVLEVTNCFPFPVREDDEEIEADGVNYQLEMMRCLREVNVDNHAVGWRAFFCMCELFRVAVQIIPWSFSLLMYAWKVGPALACGNTIILKTAEKTPLSALYVSNLFHEVGLPPGVLNIVSGYGPNTGASLASHMEVDKLAFTGSTVTGQIVLGLVAKYNLKPVTLELDWKSFFIVCEDANVDEALELSHNDLFYN